MEGEKEGGRGKRGRRERGGEDRGVPVPWTYGCPRLTCSLGSGIWAAIQFLPRVGPAQGEGHLVGPEHQRLGLWEVRGHRLTNGGGQLWGPGQSWEMDETTHVSVRSRAPSFLSTRVTEFQSCVPRGKVLSCNLICFTQ